jgi:hypothetical protein
MGEPSKKSRKWPAHGPILRLTQDGLSPRRATASRHLHKGGEMNELNEVIQNQIQRIFNRQKRKEIGEKYHGTFHSGGKENIPPEVEAEWLQSIEQFEQQLENAEEITVSAFIGSPVFRPLEEIPVQEREEEYARMEYYLFENGIYVEYPDDLDINGRYRFITEELLHESVDDMRMEGLLRIFNYEEFHPRNDIR